MFIRCDMRKLLTKSKVMGRPTVRHKRRDVGQRVCISRLGLSILPHFKPCFFCTQNHRPRLLPLISRKGGRHDAFVVVDRFGQRFWNPSSALGEAPENPTTTLFKKTRDRGTRPSPPPLGTRFMQAAFYPRWRVFRLECMNRRDSRRRALLRWLCKEP